MNWPRLLIAFFMTSSVAATAQNLMVDPGLKSSAPTNRHWPSSQDLIASPSPDLTVTLVGSLFLNDPTGRPLPLDASVQKLLSVGGQNVTVGTLQGPLIDLPDALAYPFPWDDRPAIRSTRATGKFLKDAGFSGLMRATGHALDWGLEGMRSTAVALNEAGVVHAGAGDSLSMAAHAAYIEQVEGGGRIGLISATTTFRPSSDAMAPHTTAPGRPGVNGLEVLPVRMVSPSQRDHLQYVGCRLQNPDNVTDCGKLEPRQTVSLLGTLFRAEPDSAKWGQTDFELNVQKAKFILTNIRAAKAQSDYLLGGFNIGTSASERKSLAGLLHSAADTGADAVFATGGSDLGPIEIYRRPDGRAFPIFHGLGSFISTPESDANRHASGPREGMIVRVAQDGDRGLVDVFPLDISTGWPRLASGASAERILDRLRAISLAYGTEIESIRIGSTVKGRITFVLNGGSAK